MSWVLLMLQVHGSYRPNHHLFYDDRVAEAEDDLPKWKTIPQVTAVCERILAGKRLWPLLSLS